MDVIAPFLGEEVRTSSLILFTKYDDLIDRKKKELYENIAKDCGVPYVFWDSKHE